MNNLKKGFVTILLLLFSISTYAQDEFIVPFGGGTGDADPEPEEVPQNPIDMHTSPLLVAGLGLIASYAYFAKRRKENI